MAQTPFEFPREYHFPPFFTRQTNLTTHHAQLTKWSSLILAYCQHHRIFRLALSSAAAGPQNTPSAGSATAVSSSAAGSAPAQAEDLFFNKKLNKRLALADVKEVLDFMRKDGRAEYVGKDTTSGDVCWIYWRTPEEWAAVVEAWIDGTGQKGTVLTIYELTEGEGTTGTGESIGNNNNTPCFFCFFF
jgi:ESCRT-II complex subunit VPS25